MAKIAPPNVGEVLARAEGEWFAAIQDRYGRALRHCERGAGLCVRVVTLDAMAKRIGKHHRLADALWRSGLHDARILATWWMILVTPAQMDRWAKAFDNWGLVDTACFSLFDRTPHAFAQIDKWAKSKDEYVKRAAFALLACAALHGQGADTDYLKRMARMKRAATDGRNFVKKRVSWAVRAIGGKKGPKLRTPARERAAELAVSEDATARSIGKDALRDFSKGKRGGERDAGVLARITARSTFGSVKLGFTRLSLD